MAQDLLTKYEGVFDVAAPFEKKYNKNTVYKKYVKDLVEEIRFICDMNHIPFFATFAVENDENKTTYISEAVATGSRGYDLADNRITKHLLINTGFIVAPPAQAVPMAASELEYIAQGLTEEE